MAEYIDKEQLLSELYSKQDEPLDVMKEIANFSAADVAPVVHGVWEYEPQTINTYGMLKCSKCGWWTLDASVGDAYHFCPKCGAKMDFGGSD